MRRKGRGGTKPLLVTGDDREPGQEQKKRVDMRQNMSIGGFQDCRSLFRMIPVSGRNMVGNLSLLETFLLVHASAHPGMLFRLLWDGAGCISPRRICSQSALRFFSTWISSARSRVPSQAALLRGCLCGRQCQERSQHTLHAFSLNTLLSFLFYQEFHNSL
jgi:hypothetical protein